MSSTTLKRRIILALPVTLALALAAVVYADFEIQPGAAISQTNEAPVIKVTAVGRDDRYDTVESKGSLDFYVKVRGSCDDGWKVGSATLTVKGKVHHLEVNNSLGSIGFDNGEKWSFQVAKFPYLPPDTQSPPVAMCNAELERRLARGDSKAEVLSKGFDLTVAHAYDAELSVMCVRKKVFLESYHYSPDTKLPVTISCQPTGYKVERTPGAPKRTPGAPKRTPSLPGRLPVPEPPIKSLSLVADPSATTGRQCPVYVNFRGTIRTGENSTYQTFNTKYRFVGEGGYEMPWTFIAIELGEPRTINGRRFIQAPASKPGGTILAPGEKAKIPLYRGWTELEVLLPNGSIRSERANFTVDCNVSPGRPKIKASND